MSDYLNLEDWQLLIGKLIMSCTKVEYEFIRLYDIWLTGRDYKKDNYEDRFNKSIGICKKKLGEKHILISQLIEMKRYSDYRHLVAHNPVHYSNETDQWKIFDLKNNKDSIDLESLKLLANKAELLSIRLCANLRINVS